MVNSGAVRTSALSSPAASSACALKGGLDSVGVKMVAGEAIRRLKLEEEEGAESPCVSRVRGMKKLLTAVKSRMGGVHWSNTEDQKGGGGKVLTDSTNKAKKSVVKLTYDEKKELTALPALIEQLEAEIAAFEVTLADPDTYQNGSDKIVELNKSVSDAQAKLDKAYTRWEDLSERDDA